MIDVEGLRDASEIEQFFFFACRCADAADAHLRASFENPVTLSTKAGNEIVTNADTQLNDLIIKRIREKFPEHGILSEEMSEADHGRYSGTGDFWIVDPLDGSANFLRQSDMFATALAFVRNGRVRLAVVSSPLREERFTAVKGAGAWLNGMPIATAGTAALSEAVIGTGFPKQRSEQDLVKLTGQLRSVLAAAYDVRRSGSPCLDLCFVACGRLDGFYEKLKPWDFAAGALIALEAGAHSNPNLLNLESAEKKHVLVSAPEIYLSLERLVSSGDRCGVNPWIEQKNEG